MKKLFFALVLSLFLFAAPTALFAQAPSPVTIQHGASTIVEGGWVEDSEVTVAGRLAAISGQLFDNTIRSYQWPCNLNNKIINCGEENTSLVQAVQTFTLLFLVVGVLAIACLTVNKRERLTQMPPIVAALLLMLFSYAFILFSYQTTDLALGALLSYGNTNFCPPICISQVQVFYLGWNPTEAFIGLKRSGDSYAQSVATNLLFTKLSFVSYYAISILLTIRKMLLWVFLLALPIALFMSARYGKYKVVNITVREFFRWVLYAPLFALFLKINTYIWDTYFPVWFGTLQASHKVTLPTATNILLGFPRQAVTPQFHINSTETILIFSLSLIMFWLAIILPWILLALLLRQQLFPLEKIELVRRLQK